MGVERCFGRWEKEGGRKEEEGGRKEKEGGRKEKERGRKEKGRGREGEKERGREKINMSHFYKIYTKNLKNFRASRE